MTKRQQQHKEQTVQRIAREVLDLETLEPRGRDHLDFHELSVWQIRQALEQGHDRSHDGQGLLDHQRPTPAATLYSALLREIQKKGDANRFAKVERGKFTLTSTAAPRRANG
jgi:hypothetical protein